MNQKNIFRYYVLCAAIVLISTLILQNKGGLPVVIVDTTNKDALNQSLVNLFDSLKLDAKAVYVYDVNNDKVLFEKNSEVQLPLASLTKLMVAISVSDIVPDYLLVPITTSDLREEGDTGLKNGERWRLNRLLDLALVTSSNDAIHAIASIAGATLVKNAPSEETLVNSFVEYMNHKTKEIGLSQTYFLNNSGLDLSSGTSGGYGSAKDMTKLVAHIIKEKPKLLEATSHAKLAVASDTEIHNVENTDKALASIPNVIASKTGYTDLSGGNLVVAWSAGLSRPIIISILGSTYEGRFDDMIKLVQTTLTYLENGYTEPSLAK